jgi:nucleotide-binding universal stress UspA family protein
MIKRVLVALDGSPASGAARALAIGIARQRGAALTGMGVVDRPGITAPWATPIGGGPYKEHRDQVLLEESRLGTEAVLAAFRDACRAAEVVADVVVTEGVPAEQIELEAERHDLIVIGKDTNFHLDPEHDTAETVARLLRDNPRPMIVTPVAATGEPIVVCYDGSLQASRAIHMFVLLGLAVGKEVHVLSVASDRSEGEARAHRAARLFESHGLQVHTHGIASEADPADILLAEAATLSAGLLAMGAFGHSGLREALLGSVTRTLLRRCETALFIHH